MFYTKPQEEQEVLVGIPKEVRESENEEEATVTSIEDSPPVPAAAEQFLQDEDAGHTEGDGSKM
eukprot:9037968-Ditylum_brightwellii.AAC.1